jgi:hypothetical protein
MSIEFIDNNISLTHRLLSFIQKNVTRFVFVATKDDKEISELLCFHITAPTIDKCFYHIFKQNHIVYAIHLFYTNNLLSLFFHLLNETINANVNKHT